MQQPSKMSAVRGTIYYLIDDPFLTDDPISARRYESDGVILINDGRIEAVGPYDALKSRLAGVEITHYLNDVIVPGFIDCHIHFPQVDVIASYGTQLLEWLNKYTFPTEGSFADEMVANETAEFFVKELLRNGTTAASVYCTVHPHSVDALFTAAAAFNMRVSAGKVMMDRNAPEYLQDTPQTSYEQSKALLEKWHRKGRAVYCVTPRFAITSTPEQLERASALWHKYDDVLLQTHISENLAEIEMVQKLFPDFATYTAVYDHFELLGERAIYGHAIHFSEAEFRRFFETGTTIAHCPTSNTFIGSGLFDIKSAKRAARPIRTGVATDVGGGSSFSMLQTLSEAYKVAQLSGYSLSVIHNFYLATLGSAETMYMEKQIGTFKPGYEADFTILDPAATALLERRTKKAQSIEDILFALMILGDDRTVRATYIMGQLVHQRDS